MPTIRRMRAPLVLLAGLVEDADVAAEVHRLLVGIRDADVVHRPGEPAGEVADLHEDLALVLRLDVPDQVLRLLAGEDGVGDLDRVGVLQRAELDAGRVDQRVGPGELEPVRPALERHVAALLDEGDVLGVVDRELHALPVRAA